MGILLAIWIAASIEGRLWNPVTGAPVRKADVIVGTTDGVQVTRALSDVNGRYVVAGLPAGRYRVAAGRAGYLPALADTVISLKADEVRRDVNIAMDLPATISGHVFDAEGDPVEHVTVTAFHAANGLVARVAGGQTDDRGEYRIAGLNAGHYLLRTSQAGEYAPVFYPTAPELESASPVNVARGSEARDIDLTVSKEPLGTVNASLHGPANLLASLQVSRRSTDPAMWAMPDAEARVVTGRQFAFSKLAPGTYVFMAWAEQIDGSLLWASKEVTVSGNEAAVDLALEPAREMEGEVNAPAAVVLRRADRFHSESQADANGKLKFRNITPGTWVLKVLPADPNLSVDSVRWGEKEVLGKPIEIDGGDLPKLRIHLAARK